MKWHVRALALVPSIMALGACGTMERFRPAPVVVTQPVVIPAECRLDPVEPREVSEPSLLPETGVTPMEVARNSLANARLAFLFWQDKASAEREARETNAATQAACASWARRQDQ